MPNRYVRESAIESETVDRLSWAGEVFWRRLINRVDDFGRYTANPELLRAALFPLRLNKVSAADIGKMLLECEQSGLVSTWKGEDGKVYMALHKWEQGRAKTSRYPEPPPDIMDRLQTSVNGCEHLFSNAPDSDTDSDTDSDSKAHKGPKSEIELKFEEFRKAYPGSKLGFSTEWGLFRQKAKKMRRSLTELVPLLMVGLDKEKAYRAACARVAEKEGGSVFVPEWKHLKTWISKECWEQEFPTTVTVRG